MNVRRPVTAACGVAVLAVPLGIWWFAFRMPGASDCEKVEAVEVQVAAELAKHVEYLAATIGERPVEKPEALETSARYIERQLARTGWRTVRQPAGDGEHLYNVVAEREPPGAGRLLVVGAHFDTVAGSPGADDNASGVAVLLEIGRLLPASDGGRVRLAAFTNEEVSSDETQRQGSDFAAAESRRRGEDLVGMLALESLGFFSDEPGSQGYPSSLPRLFPLVGNYLVMIADPSSRRLLHGTIAAFRATSSIGAEGAVLSPALIPDATRSDHASYWDYGYPAVLITDTAEFRNPHYHRASDLPHTLDYQRAASATIGIVSAVRCLVR